MFPRFTQQVVKRWFGGLLCFCLFGPCLAEVVSVPPGEEALKQALVQAQAGDTLQLQVGLYPGTFVIDKSIHLIGKPGSVIDGGGKRRPLTVDAPEVRVEGITVKNSGVDLSVEDSGIFVTPKGDRAVIVRNTLLNNLIGVYLKGPENALVAHNIITGLKDMRVNERGNGVHIWNSTGSVVEANQVSFGRDGIFVTTSNNNRFLDNQFQNLRFAVHYMYTNHSEISGNLSKGNHVGYALMYSHHLVVKNNQSSGDRDRGILFNFTNYSDIQGNRVENYPEKCVFIYNSNYNNIQKNFFKGCEIGIHFTAGSEQNQIWENAFLNNKTQVKYVGSRYLEWSHNGKGNYWSDHTGFDLDGDQVADKPYRPNGLMDQILWRHPTSKILLNSPVFQVLQWSQSQFPGLHPGGVIDSAPMMSPAL